MSELYDLKQRIEEMIKAARLDEKTVKGKIALRSGTLLAFISPSTPDEPEAVARLKQAAREVLNINL